MSRQKVGKAKISKVAILVMAGGFALGIAGNVSAETAEDGHDAEGFAEIVNPEFPAGITRMEPGAYVQTGLVGHFDGIRNAGLDLPHDPAARTWKNLVGGGPDAPFEGAGGYWNMDGTGFHFDGETVYARLSSPGIDLNHENATIQLVLDASTSEQATGSSFYPVFFYSSDDDDFGFFLNNNNNSGKKDTTLTWKVKAYRTDNRPQIENWGGKYVTGIFTPDSQYLTEGTELVNPKTCQKKYDKGFKRFSWGGSVRETEKRYSKGTYHSVRIYNATLAEKDLRWNRIVDEVRFRNLVTGAIVVVASNRANAEGTEANGAYYVNGNHTFTAPAEVTIGDCVYENAGYKLERYDPDKKKWDVVGECGDASFAYTNCAANTGARITWNWRLKRGVKKIDADDYVQGGLRLHFDGIRNAGLGVAHDSSAMKWTNLASGPDASLVTFSSERGSGSWSGNGYDFTAGSCFETDRGIALYRQASVQFAVEYSASRQIARWPCFFSTVLDSDRFISYTYTPLDNNDNNRGDHLRFNTKVLSDNSFGIDAWRGRQASLVLDYDFSSVSNAELYASNKGSYKANIGAYKYCIGAGRMSANHRMDRAYVGLYHAFRLYDRVLTQSETAKNLEIDNIRFYTGASRSSDVNIVEVAVESPGGAVSVDEEGCWIVRGDGISKTFSAPSAVTVGKNAYTCTGYRLETWNAAKRMWENPTESDSLTSVELSPSEQNRRLTWLYTLSSGVRTAASYDVCDYVQKGLVANYDGIRNFGPASPHGTLSQYWMDCSYRDVPMIAASNTAFKAWVPFGHHFEAKEVNFFETMEPISLGQNGTVQSVMDTDPDSQTKNWPLYFGFGNSDYSFFTRSNNKRRLEVKYPDWIGGNLLLHEWKGKYFTWMVTEAKHYLIEDTVIGDGTDRTNQAGIPENKKFAIGAPNTYASYGDREKRSMTGDYYALRIYNRKLTEEEIVHNRKVDEIRYRGNFTNVNVTVVCETPLDGVAAPVAVPAGDYEVTGRFTFTAESITVGESTFTAYHTVETWDGGEWGAPVKCDSSSYTYTPGDAKVRLTWKWSNPTEPLKAVWTGGGEPGNLLDPETWSCVNAAGETISAAPTESTTITVSGTTSFSIPEGTASFPWRNVRFGAQAHTSTRFGTLALNSNEGFSEMEAGSFPLNPHSDADLTKLNGGDTGPNGEWLKKYIKTKRTRFDGWINVSAEQAGTWEIKQGFDDYFGFALDGEWLIINRSYVFYGIATIDVSEGWHRFTIVCGDTSGGFGSNGNSCATVNGECVPLSITVNGKEFSFTDGTSLAFGADEPGRITLSADCDWSALGNVVLESGTVIDLAGHNLNLSSTSSDFIGTFITNSNDEVQSVVTFTAPEGATVTNGVNICGNIKVVKKGLGVYCACAAGCSYTGGTFIEEGTAQPPDGSGSNMAFSWDSFKAFGLGEINVASGATFDLRANYAYRSRTVLNGGTLANTASDMNSDSASGSGIGRITADSTLDVPASIVFGDNDGRGDMDLGGNTLTVNIGTRGMHLYLRCANIENGTICLASGGWLQNVNECIATSVDFMVNCALKIYADLSVRNYEAIWSSKNYNEGTGMLKVYGRFVPSPDHNCFYGCTMQDGSVVDLSGRTGAFSTLSSFTQGSTNLQFAANANVTVNLAGRDDLREIAKDKGFVMTWPEGLGPATDVRFNVDGNTRQEHFNVIRDDENNGLRLVYMPGFTLIVR